MPTPVGVTALRAVYRPIIKATDPTGIDNLLPVSVGVSEIRHPDLPPILLIITASSAPIHNANSVGVTALRAVYRPIIKVTGPTCIDNLFPYR